MAKHRKPVVYLGTDHAALDLKEAVKAMLVRAGHKVVDMGAFKKNAEDDYPDFIVPAAEAAAGSRGRAVAIVMGGTGIGECIAANKVPGARAALVYDTYTAKRSREHNDANVLCLGSRTVTKDTKLALRLVRTWLATPFSAATRHKRRLAKIRKYERRSGPDLPDEESHPSLGGNCVHDR